MRLRKPHPCGGYDWQVTRLGADIGLRCLGCGRRVLLERPLLEKRLKEFVFRAGAAATPPLPSNDEGMQDSPDSPAHSSFDRLRTNGVMEDAPPPPRA